MVIEAQEENHVPSIPSRMATLLATELRGAVLYIWHRRVILVVAIVATAATCGHYLITMLAWTVPGFALDDSWIHLNFARTIFEGRPWEYSPGYPSTGSTSPLWSLVLCPLFFLTQDTTGLVWGTLAVASVLYGCSSFLAGLIVHDHTTNDLYSSLAVVGFVLVPRNTWLMLSGMETPLFVTIILLSILLLQKAPMRYDILLGVVCGLAFLSRPEGVLVTLVLVPFRMVVLSSRHELSVKRLGSTFLLMAIALAVASPWILYCLMTTGYPLPDTIYAKAHTVQQSEIDLWLSWWTYFLNTMPFLLIGLILGVWLARKGYPYIWLMAISMILLYHFTAPFHALINNTRYLVPVFDLLMITAASGAALLAAKAISASKADASKLSPSAERLSNVLVAVFVVAIVILPVLPDYTWQSTLFGNSVKNINEQQVTIGLWLRDNTPEDAVLAIHDAGALRFISNRTVVDLAGLVSPDIVHGNMTPHETIAYLHDCGCDYFVFFDELFVFWAWQLGYCHTKLYTVHLNDNVISGRDTMSVWYINWSLTSYGPRSCCPDDCTADVAFQLDLNRCLWS